MKKTIIIFVTISIVTVICAFLVNSFLNDNLEKNKLQIAEKITDECTEEYEEMQKDLTETVNAEDDEKITLNTKFILKKEFTRCNHSTEEEIELPKELVNKTLDELKEEYSDWEIEEFSPEKVILSKKIDEQCDEHYLLKDNEGLIAIYMQDEDGNEHLLKKTEISTEYLTKSDLQKIKTGLKVVGTKQLNEVLEDFE